MPFLFFEYSAYLLISRQFQIRISIVISSIFYPIISNIIDHVLNSIYWTGAPFFHCSYPFFKRTADSRITSVIALNLRMKYFRTQVVNLKINPGMLDILDFLIQKTTSDTTGWWTYLNEFIMKIIILLLNNTLADGQNVKFNFEFKQLIFIKKMDDGHTKMVYFFSFSLFFFQILKVGCNLKPTDLEPKSFLLMRL